MIYLITATPGSGKTLWAVNEIFKRVNEPDPWNIFSNIDGLKLDTAEPLKDSFSDYPPRSLVVIDEAQKVTHFSKKYKHPVRNESHPEVEFLQTHRHAEFLDIIFITQAPRLLNVDVLDMVGSHYHLHRPMGMKMATWWLWKYHQLNPNTKSAKSDAEDTGTFTYPKHLFSMYKSSNGGEDSHGKIKIPMKIINAIWMLVLILGVTGWLYVKQKPDETVGLSEKEEKTIKNELPSVVGLDVLNADQAVRDLSVECRKGENVEKPECKKWFDDLSKSNASVQSNGAVVASYDSSKPYDFKPQPQVEVRDYPRLTGCARDLKGQYVGIDQQGNLMPQIAQSDCKKWISGYRTFDYTKAPVEVKNNAAIPAETNNMQAPQPTVQELAQMEEAKAQGLI